MSSVDYFVQRVLDGGRVIEKHLRVAGMVRGSLTITQEEDSVRHRALLVARLAPQGAGRSIPPLFDVAVVASTGETWTLAGFERIEAGPLRQLHFVAQSWIVEPAAVQDLIDVERKWGAAAGRVHELEQLLAAQAAPPAAAKP
jgi:hypothetical protein